MNIAAAAIVNIVEGDIYIKKIIFNLMMMMILMMKLGQVGERRKGVHLTTKNHQETGPGDQSHSRWLLWQTTFWGCAAAGV